MSSERPPGNSRSVSAAVMLLVVRVIFAGLIFVLHGLHKVSDGLALLRDGTPWPLAEEIRAMGLPAAAFQATLVTIIQITAPVFLILGVGTRTASGFIALVMCGAILQNLQEGSDPQLAVLYLLLSIVFLALGSGRWSRLRFRKGNSHG